jgi:hypothetical protein
MDTLAVSHVGSLFPRSQAEFRVHSVFISAINLIGSHDPYPAALLKNTVHRHPRGAVVPLAPETDFGAWGIESGTRAVLKDGRLKFETELPPEIDLGAATGFEEVIAPAKISRHTFGQAKTLLRQRQLAADTPLRIGAPAQTLFQRRFDEALTLLAVDFDRGARLLIGFGEGMTPSGDDFIIGWLAAAQISGIETPSLGGLKTSTNLISASFLDAAERRLFSSALVSLAKAMADSSPLSVIFDSLAHIGHSSGLDAAMGFLCGIEIFQQGGTHE